MVGSASRSSIEVMPTNFARCCVRRLSLSRRLSHFHVCTTSPSALFPSVRILQLFRDCLRLVRHLAPGHSPKATALRHTVRSQFQANQRLQDPVQIENAKANAIRALSNYMLYQSAQKDVHMHQAMKDQVDRVKKDDQERKK